MIFDLYPIDSDGNIYSKRNHNAKLKYSRNKKGYPVVGLLVDGVIYKYAVHKLVASYFHGPCPPGMQVDHIDNNRENFHPQNLQYITASENVKKAYASGRKDHAGFRAGASKYTSLDFERVLFAINSGLTNASIVAATGVKVGTVKKLRNKSHFYTREKYETE